MFSAPHTVCFLSDEINDILLYVMRRESPYAVFHLCKYFHNLTYQHLPLTGRDEIGFKLVTTQTRVGYLSILSPTECTASVIHRIVGNILLHNI